MKKIYVVTAGDYSDYRIVAMFSTKKLAQSFIDSFAASTVYDRFNDVEEYELNPFKSDLSAGRKPYIVRMCKDGQVKQVKLVEASDFHQSDRYSYGNEINISCFANDETHAIKIANERRVQIIAMNRWGIDE